MKVPKHHLAGLVRFFQAESDGLTVDGIYGPNTAAEVDRYVRHEDDGFEIKDAVDAVPEMARAWRSATMDVGKHEIPPKSNSGPYVESLRVETGLDRRGGGDWCAVFVTAHCQRAGIDISSRGAATVVRDLTKLERGRRVELRDLKPGFIGLALKGTFRPTHVQFFRVYETANGDLAVQTVGGNERSFVRTTRMSLTEYLKGVMLVATYE